MYVTKQDVDGVGLMEFIGPILTEVAKAGVQIGAAKLAGSGDSGGGKKQKQELANLQLQLAQQQQALNQSTQTQHNTDYTPWIIGGFAVVGGILLFSYATNKPRRR